MAYASGIGRDVIYYCVLLFLSALLYSQGGSGSDDEALKPASIFAKKSKKVNKDTAKPKKEKSNPVNPFSINTASQVVYFICRLY